MKRHIGKIFEFTFEGYRFFGLCVYFDDVYGYLCGFSKHQEALQRWTGDLNKDDDIALYAYIRLDALIRSKNAVRVATLAGFEPFLPPMRGGGGRRPDGSAKSWAIYDSNGWRTVDADDPELPYLSQVAILGIGNIKDILVSGVSRQDEFAQSHLQVW